MTATVVTSWFGNIAICHCHGSALLVVSPEHVLAQRLLPDEHLGAVRAWKVAHVPMHPDVLVVVGATVRDECAQLTAQYWNLTCVDPFLMLFEQVSFQTELLE